MSIEIESAEYVIFHYFSFRLCCIMLLKVSYLECSFFLQCYTSDSAVLERVEFNSYITDTTGN